MDTLPKSLTITNGAMAFDGGTTVLFCMDETDTEIHLCMGWSIEQQRLGTTAFTVNEVEIPRGSEAEAGWLELLRKARIKGCQDESDSDGDSISPNALILSSDIGDYMTSIRQGPEDALRHLLERLISLIISEKHNKGQPTPVLSATEQGVRKLLMLGKRLEAMAAYRQGYSGVSPAEAKAAIDAIIEG